MNKPHLYNNYSLVPSKWQFPVTPCRGTPYNGCHQRAHVGSGMKASAAMTRIITINSNRAKTDMTITAAATAMFLPGAEVIASVVGTACEINISYIITFILTSCW